MTGPGLGVCLRRGFFSVAANPALILLLSLVISYLGIVPFDQHGLRLGAIGFLIALSVVEWLVLGFFELAMTGSFFSLWGPQPAAAGDSPPEPSV